MLGKKVGARCSCDVTAHYYDVTHLDVLHLYLVVVDEDEEVEDELVGDVDEFSEDKHHTRPHRLEHGREHLKTDHG